MIRLLLILTLTPCIAFAQDSITPEEFLSIAQGRTLEFSDGDYIVGHEQFMGDGTTRWARTNGECVIGVVTYDTETICFSYPDMAELQCWHPKRDGQTLSVEFASGENPQVQTITGISKTPVQCTMPDIGV